MFTMFLSFCSVVGQQFIEFVEELTAGGTPVLVAHNGEALQACQHSRL